MVPKNVELAMEYNFTKIGTQKMQMQASQVYYCAKSVG
jgi:hypothetical protein